jgi:uncharacterized protein involved in exopolysaccharide biosynthesis
VDPSRTPAAPDELIFADFVAPLARRWRLLAVVPVLAAAAALLLALVWPKSYTAQTSFTPEQSGGAGGVLASALGSLGGVASLLGGAVGGLPTGGGSSASASPEFFAAVLKSQELLDATLDSRFDVPGEAGAQRTLLEIMRPRGATPERRRGNARRKLAKKVVTTVDRRTGIVTASVTLPDPRLAAAVANRMSELLNVYNLERRQFSSREQRRFLAARLAQAEQELRSAERAQSAFRQQNRFFNGSAALEEQDTRLARDVRLHQEVFLTLRKSFEDARIAEVRDTPVLSTVDHAIPPDRPTNPRPVLWTVLAAGLGLVGASIIAFATASRRAAPGGATSAAKTGAAAERGAPPRVREEPRVAASEAPGPAPDWAPAPRT